MSQEAFTAPRRLPVGYLKIFKSLNARAISCRAPHEDTRTVLPTDSLMPGGVKMGVGRFWRKCWLNLAETENLYMKIGVHPIRAPSTEFRRLADV